MKYIENSSLYGKNGKKNWMTEYKSKINKEVVSKMENHILSYSYIKNLSQKGYDAMLDPVDFGGIADYPLILLNPDKSIKMTKEEKMW